MMKNIYNLGANQLSMDDFRLNIYYNDPSPLNYIKAVDNNTWPSGLDKKRLLNVFELDRLNMNGNLQEDGDGFFDVSTSISSPFWSFVNKGLGFPLILHPTHRFPISEWRA